MTFIRLFRPVLASLAMLATAASLQADPTRIAVIYADGDAPDASGFARMIDSMESLPNVEIIRLALDTHSGASYSTLLAAAGQAGALRLAAAGGSGIAVIYPDIGEPYRSVFTKIIEGIEDKAKVKVASYPVGSNFNPQQLSGDLKKQDIRVVIALGRNGLKAASSLDRDIGVVAGGVVSVAETDLRGGPVLSLAPDPSLLLARLKTLAPNIRRVFVAYEPRQNGWLIRLAKEAARQQGVELIAQEAADLKAAVLFYQDFFTSADGKRDALWLPQDSTTVDDATVLPLVLQESWNRGVPVFSSSVTHVRRGILFALYPNNVELGKALAASALGVAAGSPPSRGPLPLRDVLAAFNTRTASHLGLSTGGQGFDLLFPEQ